MIQIHLNVHGIAKDARSVAATDREAELKAQREYCGDTNIISNQPLASQRFKNNYFELFAETGDGKDVRLQIGPVFLNPSDPEQFAIELAEDGFCLRITDQLRISFYKWHALAFLQSLGCALHGLIYLREKLVNLPLERPHDPDTGYPGEQESDE